MLRMRIAVALAALASLASLACEDDPSQTIAPGSAGTTVRVAFEGSTTRDPTMPTSTQACADGVGATHIHPSWRNFAGIPMPAVLPARYEIVLSDAPVNTRLTFRVNDQNFCDENPTGAVTRNILVNDVRLTQNATTPGTGDEPGFAFTVTSDGTVRQ
jgi:hypothetical protein